MADIYIVYAREDLDVASKLHDRLSPQWDIWWDDNIVGDSAKAIEEEILKAKCILPLFSYSSRNKVTVTDELRICNQHGKKILPVELDDSDPPYPHGTLSRVNLRDWKGEEDHSGFLQLKRKLAKVVEMKENPKRPVLISNETIPLPTLFLSVSSYNTRLEPVDAIKILRLFQAPTILVSAYDLVPKGKPKTRPQKIINELIRYRKNGGFVLLDSGNYEAIRLTDEEWNPHLLEEVLSYTPHDWVFSFDKADETIPFPSSGRRKNVKLIVESIKQTQKYTLAPVLPVVHSKKLTKGYNLRYLPQTIRDIAEKLEPKLIAVPERELGAGLFDRAKMVQSIREELSKLPFYQPLHLLGTGDPWSVAIFAAAGADTFDGLEWCRMVVDCGSNRLNHYQHFDFFSYQTKMTNSLVVKAALQNWDKTGFESLVAFHNLDYYVNLMNRLRDYAMKDNMETFITRIIGNEAADELNEKIPGLFK
jgi:hypothetical protein